MASDHEVEAAIATQLTRSELQLKQRLEMGDLVSEARQVDHLAIFKSKRAANTCVTALTRAGFNIAYQERRLFKFFVEFTSDTPVDKESVNQFVPEVVRIVIEHGGSYDGWGGEVVRPEDKTS
jgi:hypothetical protein